VTTQGGCCGKCGAPYFVSSVWHGIMAPTPQPTCQCWNLPVTVTTSSVIVNPDSGYAAGFRAGVEAAAKVADEWYGPALRHARGVAANIRALAPVPSGPGWTGNQPCPTCGVVRCNVKGCECSWPSTRTDGCPLHGPPVDEQG
jgi:hypothetical protein